MYDFIMIVSFIITILFFIGFFSPKMSLFWYKGERTRKRSLIFYLPTLFVLAIISTILEPESVRKEREQEEQELLIQREKEEEEERLKKVHTIENSNDFKDNTANYTGLKIQGLFRYNSRYQIQDLREKTKQYTQDETMTLSFYYYDKNFNRFDIDVEVPVDLTVPNITNIGEEVILNFTCTKGSLKEGNIVNSIKRSE